VPVEELAVLRTWHPNLLIGGSPDAITATLETLRSDFRPAIVRSPAGATLPVQLESGVHTLVLQDVDLLSLDDQQRLLAWLKQDFRRVQVIATTPRSLVQLVESGQFDASLFYALNVVHIELPS
jgi:hypothetical protein